MSSTKEAHVRANESARSNAHGACIKKCAVEVDEHVAADFNIVPVIDVYRALHPRILVENCILFFLC